MAATTPQNTRRTPTMVAAAKKKIATKRLGRPPGTTIKARLAKRK